eukprot:TRINITY_DN22460_c0_g1_i1.p1 TRINITY_DN22460_c0_g1~~TRINITY_DN22460_c0_g1_i1.p1  ORF type:complete len:258 (+),score=94.37 TRINITY_DN22460_c0_g1_i1:62-775(+)
MAMHRARALARQLAAAGLGAAGGLAAGQVYAAENQKSAVQPPGPFVLPRLPWARNALEPHISQEQIDIHYGKHHQAYVTKLNALAEADPSLATQSLEHIIMMANGPLFNQAAQIWNHSFYWDSMSPSGGGAPAGALGARIKDEFGSFERFKEQFSAAAAGHFGSGWAWLVVGGDGKLRIYQTHDAGCPLRDGLKPLLACDVWEHAYYIDFRNRRPDYIKAWWNVVNWDFANKNLESA